jgi:hypothetical protein
MEDKVLVMVLIFIPASDREYAFVLNVIALKSPWSLIYGRKQTWGGKINWKSVGMGVMDVFITYIVYEFPPLPVLSLIIKEIDEISTTRK